MLTQNRYPDLFDWFKYFISFDEASMELLEKKEAIALEDNRQPWSEIDSSTCKRYGPSYRAPPANVCTLVVILDVYVVFQQHVERILIYLFSTVLQGVAAKQSFVGVPSMISACRTYQRGGWPVQDGGIRSYVHFYLLLL